MAKEVQGPIGLGEKEIPQELGEGGVSAGKDVQEVGLEGLDGALRGVAAVDVRRDELELALPFFLNDALVLGAGLVVENLKVDAMATGLEALHD